MNCRASGSLGVVCCPRRSREPSVDRLGRLLSRSLSGFGGSPACSWTAHRDHPLSGDLWVAMGVCCPRRSREPSLDRGSLVICGCCGGVGSLCAVQEEAGNPPLTGRQSLPLEALSAASLASAGASLASHGPRRRRARGSRRSAAAAARRFARAPSGRRVVSGASVWRGALGDSPLTPHLAVEAH